MTPAEIRLLENAHDHQAQRDPGGIAPPDPDSVSARSKARLARYVARSRASNVRRDAERGSVASVLAGWLLALVVSSAMWALLIWCYVLGQR